MGEILPFVAVTDRIKAIELRLNELNAAILFIMTSSVVRMTVASGLLDEKGQPVGKALQGTLLDFYKKAVEHGKSQLGELTIEDFQDARPVQGGILPPNAPPA